MDEHRFSCAHRGHGSAVRRPRGQAIPICTWVACGTDQGPGHANSKLLQVRLSCASSAEAELLDVTSSIFSGGRASDRSKPDEFALGVIRERRSPTSIGCS